MTYEIRFEKKFGMIKENGESFECDFRIIGTDPIDLTIAFREYISVIERFTEEKAIHEMKHIVKLTEPEEINVQETLTSLETLAKKYKNIKLQYILTSILEKEKYMNKSEKKEKCQKCSFLALESDCLCFPPYLEEIYRDFDNIHATFKEEIRGNYRQLLVVLSEDYDISEKLKDVDPVYESSLFDLDLDNEPVYVDGWVKNLRQYIDETDIVMDRVRRGKFTC
jgi:hypothetical protein